MMSWTLQHPKTGLSNSLFDLPNVVKLGQHHHKLSFQMLLFIEYFPFLHVHMPHFRLNLIVHFHILQTHNTDLAHLKLAL